jgi:hypothetical protein
MSVRSFALATVLLGLLGSIAGASTQKDLSSAANHQKIAFILVTDQGATGVEQARDLIQQAMKQVKKSTLIELDRSNPENADLVARFRLAGAPVPLVLITTRDGVLAAGVPTAQATPEQLVGMVPSPKKAEVIQALQGGKAVFITVSRKGMASQSGATATCAAACGQMADKCVMVQIDMDDPQEASFLTAMKINLSSTEPVTLVVNAQGQITGTYAGAADVATLVQAATKKGGGCAPGACGPGSGKSCGPTK